MFLVATAATAFALVGPSAQAWVLPRAGRTPVGHNHRPSAGGGSSSSSSSGRRGAGALQASLLSDPAVLEHAASLVSQAAHDPAGSLLFLADTDLSSLELPDASELLKSMPKFDDFKDSIPKLPEPPAQLNDMIKVRRSMCLDLYIYITCKQESSDRPTD